MKYEGKTLKCDCKIMKYEGKTLEYDTKTKHYDGKPRNMHINIQNTYKSE